MSNADDDPTQPRTTDETPAGTTDETTAGTTETTTTGTTGTTTTDHGDPGRQEGATPGPNPHERGKWISAIVGLLGVWMIAQAVVFDLAEAQLWNALAVGGVLVVLGAYNYFRRADERFGSVAVAGLIALVGLWLVASPFVVGPDAGTVDAVNETSAWNDVIVGLVVFILGAYSAYRAREHQEETRATAT